MVFSGSQITKGRARVVITSTGMGTEIGKIAQALESKAQNKNRGFAAFWWKLKVILGVEETTPLQKKYVLLLWQYSSRILLMPILDLTSSHTSFWRVPSS